MIKIAIDAGHGKDTYPPSKGVPQMAEFEFNSVVAGYAKELAETNDFQVVLTQPLDGNDRPLRERTDLAISERVEALISIHADAHSNSTASGFSVFYWHDDNTAKALAETWSREANKIYSHRDRGVHPSRPNHWSNFHICRVPSTNRTHRFPSILAEHAFMTNPNEIRMLLDDGFRRQSAEILVRAFCAWFNKPFREVEEVRYDNVEDMPEWAQPTIQKLIDKGILRGTGEGLDLSLDMIRIFVINDNAGVYD